MSSTPTDSKPKQQFPGRGRGSNYRGQRGGRGRGGKSRSPSLNSLPDSPGGLASPSDSKPPLLARIAIDAGKLPKSPSSPRSPLVTSSPITPSEVSSPREGHHRAPRRRKSNAAGSPKTTHPPPDSLKGTSSKSPLSNSTVEMESHITVSEVPSLPSVSENPAEKPHGIPSAIDVLKPDFIVPSPIPSPRPFTPLGRDWAAEDDDDDGGSLPSLDDWLVEASGDTEASGNRDEAKDVVKDATAATRKLSLTTNNLARVRKAHGLPSAVEKTPDSASPFAQVIPPTPVAVQPVAPAPRHFHTYSPFNPASGLGASDGNRAGRSLSRNTSPQPLNLSAARSASPAALGSGGLAPSPRPTSPRPVSGGVSLGVRSRPTSPAPGADFRSISPMPGLDPRPRSPGLGVMDPSRSPPSSPGLGGSFDPPKSRPSSPGIQPRLTGGLSGGVSLGVSRPTSPNPQANSRSVSPAVSQNQSNIAVSRPREPDTGTWRRGSNSQPQPTLAEPPVPATPPALGPAISLLDRMSDPPAVRGGRGGYRGGRGRGGRGGVGGPSSNFPHTWSPNQQGRFNHQSPSNDSAPKTPTENLSSPTTRRNRPNSYISPDNTPRSPLSIPKAQRGRDNSEAGSPTSVTSSSSTGRSARGHGHARSLSRPVISSSGLARLTASLSPSKRSKLSTTTDPVPVGGT